MNVQNCLLAAAIASLALSCSAKLEVCRVPVEELSKINGLVVNHGEQHEVIAVFPKKPDDRHKLSESKTQVFLPSATEVHEIDYSGALFSTRRLEVELHPYSTLKRVKVTSSSSVDSDLTALAAATKSAAEAAKAIEEANKPGEVEDPLEAENDAFLQEIRNLMLRANLRALKAGEPLPYPDIGV